MPIIRCATLAFAAAFSGLCAVSFTVPVQAQTAIEAAQELADMLDSATLNLSGENVVSALEGGAEAGTPIALWQLGLMYESGVGVEKDPARAFQYFSQIANDYADAPPRSLDADIVAQSFVKMGDYYLHGVPDAGVPEDNNRAHTLILHAAAYFGDAEAQYRAGMLYLDPNELGSNPLQSARWLSLAARKGHPAAQAKLGELLLGGNGIEAQPVEGLMWLTLAKRRAMGTSDEAWIGELSDAAVSSAPVAQVQAATHAADTLGPQFGGY
ncbi:tetratricopeptide repeat protein [Pelagibacterium sediminicola]|uniref:tetratricopeptide repeat protein n=1 Tax=Pelagibacterium sediminicola TaxID=2248761 RepID=UPI0018E5A602|nr:tetratricopeptide repeat protein [Pelagibacterium sediminicola]